MDTVRYGVFNLGQIWTVVCDDGVRIGFPSRALAMDAAEILAGLHRSYGAQAEIVVQDELGFLCATPRPLDVKEPRVSPES